MAEIDVTKKKKKSKQKVENKENVKADVESTEPVTAESPTKKLKTDLNDKSGTEENKADDKNYPGNMKKRLEADRAYIDSLISMVSLPGNVVKSNREIKKVKRKHDEDELLEDDSDATDDEDGVSLDPTRSRKELFVSAENRAKSHAELRERYQKKLEEARRREGKCPDQERTSKYTKAEKREWRKKEREERNKRKQMQAAGMRDKKEFTNPEEDEVVEPKEEKEERKLVYSKLAFDDPNEVKMPKKKHLDAKKALAKLQKNKEKLREWKEAGKTDKAHRVEDRIAWANAIDKASGVKVKDNVELLQKTIRRREGAKKKSTKEWTARDEKVKEKEKEKVAKRNENLAKRKKEKKDNKKKKLIKRGRIIPGI